MLNANSNYIVFFTFHYNWEKKKGGLLWLFYVSLRLFSWLFLFIYLKYHIFLYCLDQGYYLSFSDMILV